MGLVKMKGAVKGGSIVHFQKYHNTLCLSSNILHKLCSIFSWDFLWSQEKLKAMLLFLCLKIILALAYLPAKLCWYFLLS